MTASLRSLVLSWALALFVLPSGASLAEEEGQPASAQADEAASSDSDASDASDPMEGEFADTRGENLEEIVVTSTRRAESIQDVPISVTALSNQMLEDRGLVEFAQLGTFVPNLQVLPTTDTRSTSIRIRGIGSAGSNAGIDPSVGVFIDGVYQGRAGMSVGDLVDIERVEVLRGPQGTLWGKNTAAGAMSIVTKRPSYEREAFAELVFGNYYNAQVRGMVNFPIVEDRVATRISGFRVTRDGWSTNRFNGENVNNADKWGLRGKVVFDVSDAFSVEVRGDYSQENPRSFVADIISYYGPTSLPRNIDPGNPFAPLLDLGVPFRDMAALPDTPELPVADPFDQIVGANDMPVNKVIVGGAAIDMLGDWRDHAIRWLTAWRMYETESFFDGDFSIYDAVINDTSVDLNQISSELILTSPSGERFDYQAGLYFYYMDMDTKDRLQVKGDWIQVLDDRVSTVPPGTFSSVLSPTTFNDNDNTHRTMSIAAYGESGYAFVEDVFKMVLGLRITHERKTRWGSSLSNKTMIPAPPVAGPDQFMDQERAVTNLQGKVVLQYYPFSDSPFEAIDDFMTYFSFANGFKSGGFNQIRTGQALPTEFGDESSLNYELGFRSTWLDRRLTVNLTGFYTDYNDFQAQTFNGSAINVVNAGRLVSYGIEGEFNYLPPIDNLVLGSLLGWNIAEYKTFKSAPNTIGGIFQCTEGYTARPLDPLCNIQDLSGARLANAPRLTVTLFTQYEHELPWKAIRWFARGDYTYTSQVWLDTDLDDNLKQPSTNLLSLRTGLRADDDLWELTLWMENVTDDRWLVAGFDVPVVNGFAGVMAPPRHWGVTLRFRF